MLPNLATVLGWVSCDHTGPVHEGDTFTASYMSSRPCQPTTAVCWGCASLVYAVSDTAGEPDRAVLDWRFSALHF